MKSTMGIWRTIPSTTTLLISCFNSPAVILTIEIIALSLSASFLLSLSFPLVSSSSLRSCFYHHDHQHIVIISRTSSSINITSSPPPPLFFISGSSDDCSNRCQAFLEYKTTKKQDRTAYYFNVRPQSTVCDVARSFIILSDITKHSTN